MAEVTWSVQPGEKETERRHFNNLAKGSRGAGANLFTLVTSHRTQKSSMKLSQGRFWFSIREKIFTQRVFGHWNRVPRAVVTAAAGRGQEAVSTLRHRV